MSSAGYEEFHVSVGLVTPSFLLVDVVYLFLISGRREELNIKHVEECGGSVQAD